MRISIITACYNSVATIRDAIESIARQKLPEGVELEHIVIDGGSTDGTVELIHEFADRQVKVRGQGQEGNYYFRWVSEKDRGLYDALNKGIRMATGDVVGICNADDVLAADDVIFKVASAFGEGDDAIYADIRFVREAPGVRARPVRGAGTGVDALRVMPTARYCTGKFFRNWMFRFGTFPAHPSTFVRKACFEKFGLYSLDYSICADFEMMLRLFYKNKIRARYLPLCTHVMRMGGMSTGGLKANIAINRQDLQALKANGIWSSLPLIYLKYFAKVWGFVFKR